MASEHSLKLKAVLDTSQVRQQLQQLRDQQTDILGNSKQGAGLGANLNQNLNSVLSQLNRSIIALKSSIDKMNFQNKSVVASTTAPISASRPIIPVIQKPTNLPNGSIDEKIRKAFVDLDKNFKLVGLTRKEAKSFKKAYGFNFEDAIYNVFAGTDKQKIKAKRFIGEFADNPVPRVIYKRINNLSETLEEKFKAAGEKYTPSNLRKYAHNDDYTKYIDDPSYRNQINADKKALRQQRLQMAGWMTGLAFGTVGGQVASAFGSMGDESTARKVEGATQVLDFTAMGFAAGGGVGAAAGLALGGLTWAINEWTATIKESVNELNEWNAAIEKGRQFRKQLDEYNTNQSVSNRIEALTKSEDVQKLKAMAVTISDQRAMAVKTLEDQEYKSKIGAMDPEAAADAFKELQRTDALLKQINATIENIEKTKAAEAKRVQELKAQHNKVAQGQLDNYAARTRFNENSLYINDLLDGNLIEGVTPMDQVNALGERLADIRAERKGYGEKAIAAFLAAKNDNLTPEQKQKLIEEGQNWQIKENRLSPMIGSLEAALSQVALPSTPNMDNVTSIAHMGFGMGEKDDQARLDKHEQYMRDQLNVQQTIRDLIKDGVNSEATFS